MHILSCVRHTLFTIDPIIACIQEGLHIAEYDVISWRKNFIDRLASLCTLKTRNHQNFRFEFPTHLTRNT